MIKDTKKVRLAILFVLLLMVYFLGLFYSLLIIKIFIITNWFIIPLVEVEEASKLYKAQALIEGSAEEIREELFNGINHKKYDALTVDKFEIERN